MERALTGLIHKVWVIRSRPEMALLILKQITEDIRSYTSAVISHECANISPKIYMKRSESAPVLRV